MHIILHTQYYSPEVGAPQTRLHELAIGLMQHGIQVTVLTAMPSYPRGRIYAGYKGWLQTESLDGVQIIRTAIYATQSARMLPRLLSYFSFIISSFLIGVWKIKQADFVLTESPPLFLGVAGLFLSRWLRAYWIFNISDLWPESVMELGLITKNSLSYKLGGVLEKLFYKKAWIVTCQSKTILENIRQRLPDVQTYLLPNGVDTSLFQPCERQPEKKNFRVVYAGLHGLAQGLEQIIWAAQKIPSEDNIDFILIGDGPEKQRLIELNRNAQLENVHFLDPVSKEEVPGVLQNADAIVVPLKIQLTGAVPSKIYEAMAMGKPVILIAASEAAQMVNSANCGLVISPGDIEGLVTAITYLKYHPTERAQMGLRGREAALQRHDRARITNQFSQILINVHENFNVK